jgi:hypothetical protein
LCLDADIDTNAIGVDTGTLTRFGYTVFPDVVGTGNYELTGTWAVTAP